MKKVKTNYITLAALKKLNEVAEEMGHKVFAEPLTETACTFEEDGENPCSHFSVSVVKDALVDPNNPNGEWDMDAHERLSMKELHEFFQKAGMDFDLEKMFDVTDSDEYNRWVVEEGTDEPYYYWSNNLGLEIVFKLTRNSWKI